MKFITNEEYGRQDVEKLFPKAFKIVYGYGGWLVIENKKDLKTFNKTGHVKTIKSLQHPKMEITFTELMYQHALFRLTSFIEKHGYEIGRKKYKDRLNHMTNKRKVAATIAVAKHCGERNIARAAQFKLRILIS